MKNLSLVYHTGGLGDFITTLPAIKEWNLHNHSCRKILLGKPSYGILGVQAGLFDEVWDAESAAFSWLYSLEMSIPESAGKKFLQITSALLFASNDSPVVARFRNLKIKSLLFQDPFPQKRIHISAYHLSLVKNASGFTGPECHPLIPHPDFKNEANRLLDGIGRFIVFHTGSGNGIKNWPVKKFEALAGMIREKGFRIVWIAGPAEEALSSPSTDMAVRNAPLPLLVHVFARSSLYVGNDSGISHLATACGTPSVVLFGPSDPEVWRPWGKKVAVVSVTRRKCFPCHPMPRRGVKNKNAQAACKKPCMDNISVLEVFEKCEKVMKTERGRRTVFSKAVTMTMIG
jgi:heptosyltransferase III